MKQKMKKIFENAIWWSGVVMVGLILGISIQFVRAWTEPTVAPPGGNVGAPVNTSGITQDKIGLLGVLGLLTTYLNVPGDIPAVGDVLTAQESFSGSGVSDGKVAWAPGGGNGGWYVPSDIKLTSKSHDGNFGGYKGMYDWIQGNGCAGYHVCGMDEMLSYAQKNGNGSVPQGGYYADFHQTYHDGSGIGFCDGFTNSTSQVTYLILGTFPNFEIQYCSKSYPVVCCK